MLYDMVERKFYTVFKGRYPEGMANDLDGGASFWPLWIDGDRAIGFMSPESLEEDYEDERIKALYESFKEYDNPVLQVIFRK